MKLSSFRSMQFANLILNPARTSMTLRLKAVVGRWCRRMEVINTWLSSVSAGWCELWVGVHRGIYGAVICFFHIPVCICACMWMYMYVCVCGFCFVSTSKLQFNSTTDFDLSFDIVKNPWELIIEIQSIFILIKNKYESRKRFPLIRCWIDDDIFQYIKRHRSWTEIHKLKLLRYVRRRNREYNQINWFFVETDWLFNVRHTCRWPTGWLRREFTSSKMLSFGRGS